MFNDAAVLNEVKLVKQTIALNPNSHLSDSLDVCFEIGYGNLKMGRNEAITGDELVTRMSKGFSKFQLERVEILMATVDAAANNCSSIDELRRLMSLILSEVSSQLGNAS